MDATGDDDFDVVETGISKFNGNRSNPRCATSLGRVLNFDMLLETPLGSSHLLAQLGGDRLFMLNASAAELWYCFQMSTDAQVERPLVQKLMVEYGLSEADANEQVTSMLTHWHQSGLLHDGSLNSVSDWVILPPFLETPVSITFIVQMAGLDFGMWIDDQQLTEPLRVLLSSMLRDGSPRLAHQLALTGFASQWQLYVNGELSSTGQGLDNALTCVLHTLIDLACQAEDRLLVVHGAGVKLADDRGLLLIAPGGSGKTTLATALNAQGFSLLSDDVVPVTLEGKLLGLGTPICLKSGSWEVLAKLRPDIMSTSKMARFDQSVRYLPPLGQACTEPLALGMLIFPRYQPDSLPQCNALSPEVALQHIIEAEAVLRNLSQVKLDALATWVSSVPAYAISYPDLNSALKLVRLLIDKLPSSAKP